MYVFKGLVGVELLELILLSLRKIIGQILIRELEILIILNRSREGW